MSNQLLQGMSSTMNVGAIGANSGLTILPQNTNISLSNAYMIGDDLLKVESFNQHYKKYEVYELNEDVITLAITVHRLKTETNAYNRITDNNVFKNVTEDDRVKAKEIREYYKKKFTFLSLTSTHRSKYREDLLKLLSSDGKIVQENMFGIAYWLPHFYDYDLERDGVKSMVTTKGAKEKLKNKTNYHTIKLTPLKQIHRKTRSTNFIEFWFVTTDGYGFMLPSKVDNNLNPMLDYVFRNKIDMSVSTNPYVKELDNFEYLSCNKWKVEKI